MFLQIFNFELKYRLKRPATYIYWAILFFLAFLSINILGGAIDGLNIQMGYSGNVMANAPINIYVVTTYLTIFGILIISAMVGNPVYRDFEHETHGLFFTYPITKSGYLFGRYFGSAVICILVFTAVSLGLYIGSIMPWLDPEKIGANKFIYYIQPFFSNIIPNILVFGAIFFSLASLTRKILANYVGAVFLFVIYGAASSLLLGFENKALAAMLDPMGMTPIYEIIKYWTPAEKNALTIPLDGLLFANRVVWLLLGGLTLFFTYKRFSFGQFAKEINLKRLKKAVSNSTENEPNSNIAFHFTNPIFNKQTNLKNWLQITKIEFLNILKNRYFIAILFAGIAFLFSTNVNIGSLYDTNTYPVTYQVIELLNSQFFMFILIIITFFTGELIWRERGSKLNEIFDALPLKNSLIITSKFSALIFIEFFIMFVILVTGILIQISGGYYKFELDVYFKSLFLILLPNYILYTMLAFFVHILVNNKFFAHAVVIIFFLFNFMMAPGLFEHNLFIFGADSSIPYSDMNGFGHQVFSYSMFKLYWFAFAIILMLLANLFFVRGTDTNMKTRLAIAKKRINKPIVISIASTLIVFIFIGAYIYYNTNVLNVFTSRDEQIEQQYNYEINYKKYLDKAHPRITDVYIETHIFPHQQKLHLIGNYKLKNKTNRDIDTIMLNINHTYKINSLNFSSPFEIINKYTKDNFKLIVFNPSISAGDSLLFDYDMLVESIGFSALGGNSRILTNGTFIDSHMFPGFGYEKENEISDRKKRNELELPPIEGMPEINDSAALMNNYVNSDADWIHYEAVVSTSSDQIGITSGDLVREWKEGDRNYYHYKMDQKVLNFFAFISARYEVKKDKWNDIPVEVYYQKGHEYNLDYMLKGMKMSLDYCSKNFSPYQFNQLRIFEFPRFSSFVQAFPNMIPFSEGFGFIAKIETDVEAYNYPFFIAAHETAHQWWAHQVISAGVKGVTIPTEMLAQYSALMVAKQDLSKPEMLKLLNFFLYEYLQSRSTEKDKESTMMLNENQIYLNYYKSILVMNTLENFIGEDSINSALACYIKHVGYQEPPYTTSAELIDHFKQVTPDSLLYLYNDLFEKITLYSNRTDKAEYKKLDNGKYEVNLSIEAKKFYADSIGNEEQTPVDEWIDVVVFAEDAEGKAVEEIYCKKHKINHEKTNIRIIVARKPIRAGVDPYYLYIDKIMVDNVINVREKKNIE